MAELMLFDKKHLSQLYDDLTFARSKDEADELMECILSYMTPLDDAAREKGGKHLAGVMDNNGVYFTHQDGTELFDTALASALNQGEKYV